jgi:hypothetical protein
MIGCKHAESSMLVHSTFGVFPLTGRVPAPSTTPSHFSIACCCLVCGCGSIAACCGVSSQLARALRWNPPLAHERTAKT